MSRVERNVDRAVLRALREAGASLKRVGKHLIYALPNGRNVVVGITPSDHHATKNAIAVIRRLSREAI